MQTLTLALFAATLFLCGGYAGMTLFCQIGILPTMRRLDPRAFVSTWGILDGLMERAMPPYKLTLLAVNLACAVCFWLQRRSGLAIAAGGSFLLSLAALILTVAQQVPLNRRIRTYPAESNVEPLLQLRRQTETNFTIRFVMALAAFAILCAAAVALPLA